VRRKLSSSKSLPSCADGQIVAAAVQLLLEVEIVQAQPGELEGPWDGRVVEDGCCGYPAAVRLAERQAEKDLAPRLLHEDRLDRIHGGLEPVLHISFQRLQRSPVLTGGGLLRRNGGPAVLVLFQRPKPEIGAERRREGHRGIIKEDGEASIGS
jgi:hypothetical protein